mgnify:CR=1 FL=1
MHVLLALLLACSGDDPEPQNTDTTDTDTDTDTDTGVPVTVDSATGDTATTDTEPTAVTGTTGTTGATGATGDTGLDGDLAGRAYRFTPSGINIIQPVGAVYLVDTVFIMEIIGHDVAANTMDVRVGNWNWPGYGLPVGQNMCSPTADITDVDLSTAPTVTLGPVSGAFIVATSPFGIEDAVAEITFDATFDEVTDASLEALVDVAPLATSYGYGPGYFCSAVGGCTTCPSTGQNTCVTWEANNARARVDPALTVVERTLVDIQADPACN